jgi:hypothetical protein
VANLLIVILSAVAFSFLPGAMLIGRLRVIGIVNTITVTIFMSLGFWICFAWFAKSAHAPLLQSAVAILLVFAVIWFVLAFRNKQKPTLFTIPKISLPELTFFTACVFLLLPLTYITIPPGCDTAMHGYITRLIINNNGLPDTYRPILPVDYFGSYSAGYHTLTAIFSWCKIAYLPEAVNFISIITYPLAFLSLLYFLWQLMPAAPAFLGCVIFWGTNTSMQSTIMWGGNPTMLAFAFCLFCAGTIIAGIKTRNRFLFLSAALPFAAVCLTHAIPFAVFCYLLVPAGAVMLLLFKSKPASVLRLGFTFSAITALLLLPFLIRFRAEHSTILILRIKSWQMEMTDHLFNNDIWNNIWATCSTIVRRVGDIPIALSAVCIVVLLSARQYRKIAVVTLFTACCAVMVFNCNYWLLPGSELLYPERVCFFLAPIPAVLFGITYKYLLNEKFVVKIIQYRLKPLLLPVWVFVTIALCWTYNNSNRLHSNPISYSGGTKAAFRWINEYTAENCVCVASYNDIGMWIPAFCNRATIGTHLHFIHENLNVVDSLEKRPEPKYIFVTRRDFSEHSKILERIIGRQLVFENADVAIYR